eukprot:SAG31_NODE_1223_length_9288_cov_8.411253_5_plen_170_part_00
MHSSNSAAYVNAQWFVRYERKLGVELQQGTQMCKYHIDIWFTTRGRNAIKEVAIHQLRQHFLQVNQIGAGKSPRFGDRRITVVEGDKHVMREIIHVRRRVIAPWLLVADVDADCWPNHARLRRQCWWQHHAKSCVIDSKHGTLPRPPLSQMSIESRLNFGQRLSAIFSD